MTTDQTGGEPSLVARLGRTAWAVGSGLGGAAVAAARVLPPVDRALDWTEDQVRSATKEATALSEEALVALVLRVLDAVLDRIDLTALIRQRVDITELSKDFDPSGLLERIDPHTVVDKVDLNAIVERIDIDAVVDRVDPHRLLDRIDVDALADRVNVDRVAMRVDPAILLARLDLIALAGEVVDGIDLGEIIRRSTGALSAEAVQGLRTQSRYADAVVARLVSRLRRDRTDAIEQGRR